MFSRRSDVELQLIEKLARANATILELSKQIATEKSRFEWLSAHVNQLQTERAILLDRVLGVQVPVMTLERAPEPPAAAPTRDVIDPQKLRSMTAFAPAPGGSPGQVFRPAADDVKRRIDDQTLFEDVGDDEARRIGVGWDGEGVAVPVFAGTGTTGE